MESIIELVLNTFDINDKAKVGDFLEYLKNGTKYQQRLLICLGIDIKANLLDNTLMSKVFNSIDYDSSLKSSLVLDSYEAAIINLGVLVSQIHKRPKESSIRLARVMKSSVFSLYFYPKTIGIYDVNPDWRNVKREIERGNLDSINMPNYAQKPRNLVWCTPLKELEELINECNDLSKNPANEIVDRLGLCVNAEINNEYVYIEYGEDFNELIYQPCNFSNSWIDESSLYISSKSDDGFGRTRPRSGDNVSKQMKEVIHSSIENPRDFNCAVRLLGNLTDFALNTTDFNTEAMKRYTI